MEPDAAQIPGRGGDQGRVDLCYWQARRNQDVQRAAFLLDPLCREADGGLVSDIELDEPPVQARRAQFGLSGLATSLVPGTQIDGHAKLG